MTDCRMCGQPLTRGNIKMVRSRGKKRPYRVHRTCPESIQAHSDELPEAICFNEPEIKKETSLSSYERGKELIGQMSGIKYRYFIKLATAEKIDRALDRGWGNTGLPVTIEIIPIAEAYIDMNPEVIDGLVELEIKHFEV